MESLVAFRVLWGRQTAYWVIFVLYALGMTAFLGDASRVANEEIALVSVSAYTLEQL